MNNFVCERVFSFPKCTSAYGIGLISDQCVPIITFPPVSQLLGTLHSTGLSATMTMTIGNAVGMVVAQKKSCCMIIISLTITYGQYYMGLVVPSKNPILTDDALKGLS